MLFEGLETVVGPEQIPTEVPFLVQSGPSRWLQKCGLSSKRGTLYSSRIV